MHDILRGLLRNRDDRKLSPSVGCIDSQSAKGTYRGRERGIDGGKRVKGRKRHIVTDTRGLLPTVNVLPANRAYCKVAMEFSRMVKLAHKRLRIIYADGGYRGDLKHVVKRELKCNLKITLRSDTSKKFVPLPKRWVVERTFGRFESYRRLSREYEFLTTNAKNMIHLALMRLMIKRL